jgi:F-box protein 21
VFETGQGIPISLSVIAAEVGRRAGLSLEYIGSAGHFLTALAPRGDGDEYYLDSFNGRVMSRREAEDFLQGQGVPLQMQALHAVGAREVLQRMATNLLRVYLGAAQRLPEARCVLQLMCVISPDDQGCRFDLAQVCLALSDYTASLEACMAIVQAGRMDMGIAMQLPQLEKRAERERDALDAEARAPPRARPPGVLHRVGQVVQHKRYAYRGVIYGWDDRCKATDHWMQTMNIDGLPGGRRQPFYNVLVDSHFRPDQSTYVAQENIEVCHRGQGEDDESFLVLHSEIGEHFDGIEEGASRYTPNAYRRMLYPEG